MKSRLYLIPSVVLALASASLAAPTLSPMASFGVNGWLAPGAAGLTSATTTGDFQRDMAYNPISGNLIVPTRSGGTGINVINSTTGLVTSSLNVTGVTGGTFTINGVGVAADGKIYVANLATSASGTPFKVYQWNNEAAAPTVAYTGAAPLGAVRAGDDFAVTGSGTSTKLVAGYGSGVSGYALMDTTDGSTFTGHTYAPAGTATGDYRLGIGFVDGDTLIGSQNSATFRVTNFTTAPDVASLVGTLTLATVGATNTERGLDVAVVAGHVLLATLQTGASAVRVYDLGLASGPLNTTPTLLGVSTAQPIGTTFVANGNGTSAVAWGAISGDSATLYTLNTNNGISAYNFVLPEPASLTGIAGLGMLMARRRK